MEPIQNFNDLFVKVYGSPPKEEGAGPGGGKDGCDENIVEFNSLVDRMASFLQKRSEEFGVPEPVWRNIHPVVCLHSESMAFAMKYSPTYTYSQLDEKFHRGIAIPKQKFDGLRLACGNVVPGGDGYRRTDTFVNGIFLFVDKNGEVIAVDIMRLQTMLEKRLNNVKDNFGNQYGITSGAFTDGNNRSAYFVHSRYWQPYGNLFNWTFRDDLSPEGMRGASKREAERQAVEGSTSNI